MNNLEILFNKISTSGKEKTTWSELGKEFNLTGEQIRKRYKRWKGSVEQTNKPGINGTSFKIELDKAWYQRPINNPSGDAPVMNTLNYPPYHPYPFPITPYSYPYPTEPYDIVTTTTTPYVNFAPIPNSNNVLVIGDLHEPFAHKDYLQFVKDVRDKYDCGTIVFIGDVVDFSSMSYHEKNPDMPAPGDELAWARTQLAKWYKEFPNAVVLGGNHDTLLARKVKSAGLPAGVLRPLNEILQVPNWTFVDQYVHNNIMYTHGTGLTSATVDSKALYMNQSLVIGHLHTIAKVNYLRPNLFTMAVGCGIDFSKPAFDYARNNSKSPINSCAVVLDGLPILIPMK